MMILMTILTTVFMADAIGTIWLLSAAKKNPLLRARVDYAFGRLINRQPQQQTNDDNNCPFC